MDNDAMICPPQVKTPSDSGLQYVQ